MLQPLPLIPDTTLQVLLPRCASDLPASNAARATFMQQREVLVTAEFPAADGCPAIKAHCRRPCLASLRNKDQPRRNERTTSQSGG